MLALTGDSGVREILILAEGATEGLESLAVLLVLLNGGLNDLKQNHKRQGPSESIPGRSGQGTMAIAFSLTNNSTFQQ